MLGTAWQAMPFAFHPPFDVVSLRPSKPEGRVLLAAPVLEGRQLRFVPTDGSTLPPVFLLAPLTIARGCIGRRGAPPSRYAFPVARTIERRLGRPDLRQSPLPWYGPYGAPREHGTAPASVGRLNESVAVSAATPWPTQPSLVDVYRSGTRGSNSRPQAWEAWHHTERVSSYGVEGRTKQPVSAAHRMP
jgi:hypothetical protein